jgi:hypothetical protein
MWKSRTKLDLMIEVWEALDCESIGEKEIVAIENAVRERFGSGAVLSPMKIARILADEGAELRHPEIMKLDVRRRTESPYDPMFRHILHFADFDQTLSSIRQLENLRRKFRSDGDAEGLRLVRETAVRGKQRAEMIAGNKSVDRKKRAEKAEIAAWFTLWLQSPEIFESWIKVRRASRDFIEKFESQPIADTESNLSAHP